MKLKEGGISPCMIQKGQEYTPASDMRFSGFQIWVLCDSKRVTSCDEPMRFSGSAWAKLYQTGSGLNMEHFQDTDFNTGI